MSHLNQLKQFLCSTDLLLLVIGNSGKNKSALLHDAITQTDADLPTVYLAGRSTIRANGLVDKLSGVWSLDIESQSGSMRDKLSRIVTTLMRRQQKATLIIDDAHLLPYSLLSSLVKVILEQQDDCYLQCVLAGRQSLVDKVQVLNENQCNVMILDRLTQRQLRCHIASYLTDVGVAANRDQINQVMNQLSVSAQSDLDLLDQKLQSLTLQDMMDFKRPPMLRGSVALRRSVGFDNHARTVALLGLVCTIGFLYWHKQTNLSSPEELLASARPINFTAAKTQIIPMPVSSKHSIVAATTSNKVKPFFTVQVLGSYHRSVVEKFMQTHQQLRQAQIYNLTYQSKPWYVVGVGKYATSQVAHQQLKHMPGSLSNQGAWVRSIH